MGGEWGQQAQAEAWVADDQHYKAPPTCTPRCMTHVACLVGVQARDDTLSRSWLDVSPV